MCVSACNCVHGREQIQIWAEQYWKNVSTTLNHMLQYRLLPIIRFIKCNPLIELKAYSEETYLSAPVFLGN